MLQAGFHRSFSELHMLMLKQSTAREAAGPDSVLWNIPLLETEKDKLESIKFYLTEAEEAMREGITVYTSYCNLILYLLSSLLSFLVQYIPARVQMFLTDWIILYQGIIVYTGMKTVTYEPK